MRSSSLGFEARCLQHELDHLDGILFLDRVESLVDDVFRRRVYARQAGSQWDLISRPARACRDRSASRGTGPSSNASAGARIG